MGEPAAVANVEPAGEAEPTVDDHDLAVVSQVGIGKIKWHARGQKPLYADATAGEHARDRREGVGRADAVDEHADLHAPSDRPAQRLREDLPGRVVVEDIGSERDAADGGIDGLEHLRVGLVATVERDDRVAVDERPGRDVAYERDE